MNADTFNSLHKVGTPVFAYPGIRPEHPVAIAYRKRANEGRAFGDKDPCKRLVTKTRTSAWELGHGAPVVSVDGYAGGIVLDHVDVVSEGEWEAAKTAEAVAAEGALPMPAGSVRLTVERLAEIKSLLRYETSISFHSARAKESMLLLVAEVERLRAELEAASEPQHFGLCHTNVRGHRLVNGHCLYCGMSAEEATS